MKYLLFIAALLTGFVNFAQKNPNPFKALPNPNAAVTFQKSGHSRFLFRPQHLQGGRGLLFNHQHV
jgi:hypothetical protein